MNLDTDKQNTSILSGSPDMAPRDLNSIFSRIPHLPGFVDSICQRIATVSRLSKLAPKRYTTYESKKSFNRFVVALLATLSVLWTIHHEYTSVVDTIEIPVLGSGEASVFGYYPPMGNRFLPKVPSYNVYSRYRPRTPLLIPFGRNESMIRQTVLSYIASGWPRADIIIVDNTGTMDANPLGRLTAENPFHLDYNRFRRRYGVSIIQTPALLNFAQLQNFMLRIALMRNWPYYFWTHQDVAVLGAEEVKPYKSFYHRIIDVLDASQVDQWSIKAPKDGLVAGGKSDRHDARGVVGDTFKRGFHTQSTPVTKNYKRGIISFGRKPKWGAKFFAYDYLSLVNVEAWRDTGQWDPFIPYYNTDCDFYARMDMAGYKIEEAYVGHVFDVAEVVKDPENRFFPGTTAASRREWSFSPTSPEPAGGKLHSGRYDWLRAELLAAQTRKLANELGRNSWQSGGLDTREPRGSGGKPIWKKLQPWTYEPRGFQTAWWNAADAGRAQYIRKWGTVECDLRAENKTMDDMWLLQYAKPSSDVYNLRLREEEDALKKMRERPIR